MSLKEQLAATVHLGKEGWLFHRDDFVVEQVAGTRSLTDHQIERWRWLLEMRHSWLLARNTDYVFMVVPEKHVIYPEKVIDGFQISEQRPWKQIERSLMSHDSGVNVVYPSEVLIRETARRDTYFTTDSHWNILGAYLAYRELCASVKRRHSLPMLREEDIALDTREFDGDLALRLDPEPVSSGLFGVIKTPRVRVVGSNGVFGRGSVFVFEQDDTSLPRAVVFRDSFANLLLPLLAESFARIVAVSSMEMYPDLVESEKPDVVITEVAERLLNKPSLTSSEAYFPDDFAAQPFEKLCRMSVRDVADCRT